METTRLILLILAFFCLFIAALQISTPPESRIPRINTTALGLALWVLAEMLKR